jgi:hypothetical protein
MTCRILYRFSIPVVYFNRNESCRYKSSDVTGVAFSPLPDAELKIQLYYKRQEIKKRKEKLKEIAKSISNNKPNVNYAQITQNECKKMYEEHTGHVPSLWETKQIYKYINFII